MVGLVITPSSSAAEFARMALLKTDVASGSGMGHPSLVGSGQAQAPRGEVEWLSRSLPECPYRCR
jgi:hypothetical protein